MSISDHLNQYFSLQKTLMDKVNIPGDYCDFRGKPWERKPGEECWFPEYGKLAIINVDPLMLQEVAVEWDKAITMDGIVFVPGHISYMENVHLLVIILDEGEEIKNG